MAKSSINHQIAVKLSLYNGYYSTELDWEHISASALCYNLDEVVFKSQNIQPNWEIIPKSIHPWSKYVLIDLRMLSFKKEKLVVRSPYNGQIQHINWKLWLGKAIKALDFFWIMPDINTLPQDVKDWVEKLPQEKILREYRVCLSSANSWLINQTCCVESVDQQYKWILFEQLCSQTAEGWVFDSKGAYTLTDPEWEISTDLLADFCECEACKLCLQRGYFYHIYKNIPLLANRYLASHNFCQLKFCI